MMLKRILLLSLSLLAALPLFGQADRKDVRAGNKMFRKNNFSQAEIDYRKGLVKDSTSFAAAYDLASTLYMQKDYDNAGATLDRVKAQAPFSVNGDRWYFNRGNVALQKKDYKAAVDAFKQALLRDPGDLEAKESYIYAKKMLENQDQQDQGDQGDNDQNQDQQDQDQQNQNQNQDQQNQQNQNQDRQDQQQQQQPEQQISAQQAQQMLKAIQAKEKETQEKVEKAKAEQAQTRRKEKNW